MLKKEPALKDKTRQRSYLATVNNYPSHFVNLTVT